MTVAEASKLVGDAVQEFGCDAHDADDPVAVLVKTTIAHLEAAAGRGLDGTGLDGRVLFGDPHDLWSLGSAAVEGTGRVHLDLLLPASVAVDVIERVVRGEPVMEPTPEIDEFVDDAAWAAAWLVRLAELTGDDAKQEVR